MSFSNNNFYTSPPPSPLPVSCLPIVGLSIASAIAHDPSSLLLSSSYPDGFPSEMECACKTCTTNGRNTHSIRCSSPTMPLVPVHAQCPLSPLEDPLAIFQGNPFRMPTNPTKIEGIDDCEDDMFPSSYSQGTSSPSPPASGPDTPLSPTIMSGDNPLMSQVNMKFNEESPEDSKQAVKSQRRAEQNRKAQKNFRIRKQRYIKTLEQKAEQLDEAYWLISQMRRENELLWSRYTELQATVRNMCGDTLPIGPTDFNQLMAGSS